MEMEVEWDTGTLFICHGDGSRRGYRHFIHMPWRWKWKGIQVLYSYAMEVEVEGDTGTLFICHGDGSRRGYRHFIHMPWRWK